MKVTEAQRLLVQLLKISGMDQETTVGIILMLKDSQEATKEMLLWLDKFNPEKKELTEEQQNGIMEKFQEIIQNNTHTVLASWR